MDGGATGTAVADAAATPFLATGLAARLEEDDDEESRSDPKDDGSEDEDEDEGAFPARRPDFFFAGVGVEARLESPMLERSLSLDESSE